MFYYIHHFAGYSLTFKTPLHQNLKWEVLYSCTGSKPDELATSYALEYQERQLARCTEQGVIRYVQYGQG